MMSRVLNLVFPPQCLHCDALVPTHGTLCNDCWKGLCFITAPMCACCGLPFEYAIGEDALCAACIQDPPSFTKARSILVFDDASKSLIHKLKFQDESYLSVIFSDWMSAQAASLIDEVDAIIPVPLHRRRLVSRRYNQSALLALELAKRTGKRYEPGWLERRRHTNPQTGLSRAEREENVRGAFRAPEGAIASLAGQTILLVDDVMTTGATIDACTRTLLKAGAKHVNVLTLARVV